MNLKHLLTNLNPFKKKEEAKVVEPIEPEIVEAEPIKNKKIVPKSHPSFEQHNWKIQEHDKQMIVSFYATGLTPTEVVDKVREELNINISTTQVYHYSKAEKWQPLINKIRQETMSDLASVAGSHKKVRLNRHENVYEKAIKKGDLKHALAATEGQRKEMEGGGDTVNLTLNQFNMLSDEELKHKQLEALNKIKLLSEKGKQ